jgi:hypothetical protein
MLQGIITEETTIGNLSSSSGVKTGNSRTSDLKLFFTFRFKPNSLERYVVFQQLYALLLRLTQIQRIR